MGGFKRGMWLFDLFVEKEGPLGLGKGGLSQQRSKRLCKVVVSRMLLRGLQHC